MYIILNKFLDIVLLKLFKRKRLHNLGEEIRFQVKFWLNKLKFKYIFASK